MTQSFIINQCNDFFDRLNDIYSSLPKDYNSVLSFKLRIIFINYFFHKFIKSFLEAEYLINPNFEDIIGNYLVRNDSIKDAYQSDDTDPRYSEIIMGVHRIIDNILEYTMVTFSEMCKSDITEIRSINNKFQGESLFNNIQNDLELYNYLEVIKWIIYISKIEYTNEVSDTTQQNLFIAYSKIKELSEKIDSVSKEYIIILLDKILLIIKINKTSLFKSGNIIENHRFVSDELNIVYESIISPSKQIINSHNHDLLFFKNIYSNILHFTKVGTELDELVHFRSVIEQKISDLDKNNEVGNRLYQKYHNNLKSQNLLFLNNCILSSKIKNKQFSDNIEYDISRKALDNTNNYYQLTKSIDFLDAWIRNIKISNLDTERIIICQNLLDKIVKKLSDLRLLPPFSIKPFVLPINECFTMIKLNGNKKLSLFLLNPTIKNYTPREIQKKIDKAIFKAIELTAKLNNQIELIKTRKELQLIIDRQKDDLLKLADNAEKKIDMQNAEIKKSEKRSIEIITLFSAIVMFVAGDIQLLKGVEDMRMAISLILAFGFSLSIFVGLIMLLIGNMETRIQCKDFKSFKYKHAYFIYLILGLFAVLYFGFISGDSNIIKFFLYLK